MELLAVEVPGDGLAPEVAVAAVDVDAPRVPAVVGDADGGADAGALVADAAGVDVAVEGAWGKKLMLVRGRAWGEGVRHDGDLPWPVSWPLTVSMMSISPQAGQPVPWRMLCTKSQPFIS